MIDQQLSIFHREASSAVLMKIGSPVLYTKKAALTILGSLASRLAAKMLKECLGDS
jgi:hypothetical protein